MISFTGEGGKLEEVSGGPISIVKLVSALDTIKDEMNHTFAEVWRPRFEATNNPEEFEIVKIEMLMDGAGSIPNHMALLINNERNKLYKRVEK